MNTLRMNQIRHPLSYHTPTLLPNSMRPQGLSTAASWALNSLNNYVLSRVSRCSLCPTDGCCCACCPCCCCWATDQLGHVDLISQLELLLFFSLGYESSELLTKQIDLTPPRYCCCCCGCCRRRGVFAAATSWRTRKHRTRATSEHNWTKTPVVQPVFESAQAPSETPTLPLDRIRHSAHAPPRSVAVDPGSAWGKAVGLRWVWPHASPAGP